MRRHPSTLPARAPNRRASESPSYARALRVAGIVSTAALTAVVVAGCGSSDTADTASAPSSTMSAPRTTPAPLTTVALPPAPATRADPAPAAAPAPAVVAVMPSVVCMNLQSAQNLIQEAGVFFSRSTDATGAGRSQIVDSNWVVVGQTPLPGAPVTEGEAMLSAVKIGETASC
jgi:hypothetical protein